MDRRREEGEHAGAKKKVGKRGRDNGEKRAANRDEDCSCCAVRQEGRGTSKQAEEYTATHISLANEAV